MTNPYNGFAFMIAPQRVAARSTDVAARGVDVGRGINVGRTVAARGIRVGSVRQRQLLVIARDVHRATEIARSRVLHAMFFDAGPEILARARKLGIQDNDAGIDDGQAS